MTEKILFADHVVTGDVTRSRVRIAVRDGVITELTEAPADEDMGEETVSGWVVPGFVDSHGHGGGGHDYATTDPAEALAARDFHRRQGTTSAVASLVTASLDTLVAQLTTLVPLVRAGELAGIHLEGPFLAAGKRGAHDPTLLRPPDPESLDRLLTAGAGSILMVTVAPELPGGLDAVRRLVAAGVTAAVGHTDADADVVHRAVDAGATVATHLFNAMPPIHHRRPGPVPVLLDDDRVMVELIADGRHLHDDVVRMAVAAAGPDRVALVTDAMVAAGMPDGPYRLGGLAVQVTDGTARLTEGDGAGTIAGSTLSMADAFSRLVGLGLPVVDVARMAATTPARWHGLDGVGVLAVGRRADLAVLDDTGVLQRVMQDGEWVTAG